MFFVLDDRTVKGFYTERQQLCGQQCCRDTTAYKTTKSSAVDLWNYKQKSRSFKASTMKIQFKMKVKM